VPTIHLSLSERVYREIEEVAAALGMTRTALVKMFVLDGLKKAKEELKRRRSSEEQATELMLQIMTQLTELQEKLDERLAMLEGELYRLNSTVQRLKKKVAMLEDRVDEMTIKVPSPALVNS